MRPINSHDAGSIKPIVLSPAYAKGVVMGATVGSHCKSAFVDVVPCDDPESQHCHAMWRAVIVQQIMDAKTTSHNPEKQSRKHHALDWLFHNEDDFTMVCDLAGWEPDYVRSLCVRAQKHGFRRRIARTHKESHHE